MDFLLTNTSNNPWQFHDDDLSLEPAQGWPVIDHGIVLSLEQVVPLLQSIEIPVLSVQRIYHRSDLRSLSMQYPCHLRAPNGKGIGITVANRIDAIAACQTLFSRKVNGAFPQYLLVEMDYSLERQVSLALEIDQASDSITLLGSPRPSIEQQSPPDDDAVEIERICLPGNFETEDGLLLANKLKLGEAEGQGLARLLEKLYLMMTWAGLTRCCLDSLALGQEGEVMALSGQFLFSEASPLRRQAQAALQTETVLHPAILSHGPLAGRIRTSSLVQRESAVSQDAATPPRNDRAMTQRNVFAPPRVVRLGEGKIAVISNGFRRTMNTLEQFQRQGESIAAFVNLQGNGGIEFQASTLDIQNDSNSSKVAGSGRALFSETAPADKECLPTSIESNAEFTMPELDVFSLKRQLCQALQALDRLKAIKVILINWHSNQLPCRLLADVLVEYQGQLAQQARRSAQPVSLVVRLAGKGATGGYQRLRGEEIEAEEDLDGAIARCLGLARMGSRRSFKPN